MFVGARFVALLLPLAFAPALGALEPRQANGTFEGKEWNFEPFGAYAFPSKVGMSDEKGIRIAVSNAGFIPEGIDRYYDRRHYLDTYFRDDETLIVYFDFSPSGTYKGMSYYFGSGDGCGFCYDGSVVSTVRLTGGRAKGKVKMAPKNGETYWDIDIDVPIASDDHGTPLPAGGGELGKVYTAYHAAIVNGSSAAVKPFMVGELQSNWANEGDQIASTYRKDHPDKSFRVVKGWSRGDRALLLVEGETSYSKVKTEVQMVKEAGTWRIDNEMLQIRFEE